MTTSNKLKLLKSSFNIARFHIVPLDVRECQTARNILKKYDIGLESLDNILPLRSIPSELYSTHYYRFINAQFKDIQSEKQAKQKLYEISNLIISKSLPCFILKDY